MNKLLLAALLVSAPTFAATKIEYCNTVKNVAEQVMDLRQIGIAEDIVKDAGRNDLIFQVTVKHAYKYDVVNDQTEKQLLISKFGRDAFTACMSIKE